jgi:hypothetical protein
VSGRGGSEREFWQRPHRWVCHRGRPDITLAGSHCRDPPATVSQAELQARAGSPDPLAVTRYGADFGAVFRSVGRIRPSPHSAERVGPACAQSAPRVAPGGSESPLCRPNRVPTRPQTAPTRPTFVPMHSARSVVDFDRAEHRDGRVLRGFPVSRLCVLHEYSPPKGNTLTLSVT